MVNILMSTYNGERFIYNQIDSILAQTYSEWRLYIRDDGSRDGTKAILKAYAEAHQERIFLDESQPKGLGAMRSFGYLLEQHRDADYFAFSDQDDVWNPDKLEICMSAVLQAEQNHPDLPVVVHTDLKVVDEQLREIAPSFWRYSNIKPDLVDNHLHYLAICNSVTGCAMLFNRKARDLALPMSPNAYMHDAWIALCTLYSGGVVVPVHQATIAYRQHGDNVLGALRYSPFGRSMAQRTNDAKIAYCRAKGKVYHTYAGFIVWKIIFVVHRLLLRSWK